MQHNIFWLSCFRMVRRHLANMPMHHKDKVTELQTKLQNIEEQMIEKDKDMANAVAEWQEHCVLLEKQNTALSNELEKASSSAARRASGGDNLGNDEREGRSTRMYLVHHVGECLDSSLVYLALDRSANC